MTSVSTGAGRATITRMKPVVAGLSHWPGNAFFWLEDVQCITFCQRYYFVSPRFRSVSASNVLINPSISADMDSNS